MFLPSFCVRLYITVRLNYLKHTVLNDTVYCFDQSRGKYIV